MSATAGDSILKPKPRLRASLLGMRAHRQHGTAEDGHAIACVVGKLTSSRNLEVGRAPVPRTKGAGAVKGSVFALPAMRTSSRMRLP